MIAPVRLTPDGLQISLHLTACPELLEAVRMLLHSTMTVDSGQLQQRSFSWPPSLDDSEPRTPNEEGRETASNNRSQKTFLSLFHSEILPLLEIEDKPSTISGYKTAVTHFCDWFDSLKTPPETGDNSASSEMRAKHNRRSMGPKVVDLENHPTLLARFYVFSLKKQGEKTASNKLKSLRTVWRTLYREGHLKKPVPELRTRQIRKQQKVDRVKRVPIPASNAEIDAMLTAVIDIREDLTWPNLGSLESWQFWWNVIAVCTVHGFRPGDIWPREQKHGLGLTWKEVSIDPSPPIAGGEQERLKANWEFGYISKRTNKTGETLIAPMSPHLRWFVEQCRGLDPVRVFPIPYNGKFWDREFNKIRTEAGLAHVSLCDGAPSASLRKTASVLWKRAVNRSASSHMLCHAIDASEDRSSDITEKHYAGADILREIVQGYPQLLASLPSLIRC